MLTGTFCRSSTCFWAVTMTSSRVPASEVSCAYAAGIAVRSVAGKGMLASIAPARLSFRSLLLVMNFPFSQDLRPINPRRERDSKLRHRWIAFQHGPERGLERPEVCIVVTPMFDGVAENGLADLLGAGGPDRA